MAPTLTQIRYDQNAAYVVSNKKQYEEYENLKELYKLNCAFEIAHFPKMTQ